MVLNSLSLSEHLQRENTRKGNSVAGVEEDDHTETTFSIDDSFVAFHDDSLKSNSSSRLLNTSGYLPTVAESGSNFEKVPMSWLEPRLHKHNSMRSTAMQKNNSIRSYVTAREDLEDDDFDEDDEYELDMRDLMKESRMMSDCSFKPCHDSMEDSVEWDDMRDYMKSSRMMSDCSFKPQDSTESLDGWGSMRDLSIRESVAYPRKQHAEINDTSSMLLEYVQDSTFARNMEYLQEEAKNLTTSFTTFTFMRNLETISQMILG